MDLIPVLLIGLLGSVHCVGMCGGFVFALAQTSNHRMHFLRKQSVYYVGKTITYALLGAIVGAFGHALSGLFSQLQMVLSFSLGIVLIMIGLGLIGLLKQGNSTLMKRPWELISAMIGRLLGTKSASAPFALGLINGLLPCGLVYAALALAAASGSIQQGALIMAVFGIATIPALFVTATAGVLLKPAWRHRINTLSGGVVIVLGLLTIYRGLPMAHHSHEPHSSNHPHAIEEPIQHSH